MEEKLFEIVQRFQYPASSIQSFRLMTKFHHLRIPLVILITGTACVGKSTLATMLAERLNLPSVLQTDLVYEVMKSLGSEEFRLPETPVWYREYATDEAFLGEYRRECAVIRRGLEGDIHKCLEEGKSIIIEGSHIDIAAFEDILNPGAAAATGQPSALKTDKPYITVPFLITADDVERNVFLDNYLRSANIDRTPLGGTVEEQRLRLVHIFGLAESYLLSCCSRVPNVRVIRMSARSFPQALEALQDVVVSRIEQAVTQI
mmetsp:Transcript_19058/g.45636  ORF Transcript_19058/g.45636 Transcript_19058/m.45636 type:complete len:261 (-) Transcript_19058:33-815(-)